MVYEKHPPETLPVRGRSALPGGRHRRPGSLELPPDAPALVLVVPSASAARSGRDDGVAAEIASLTRAATADIDIRIGHIYGPAGDRRTLSEVLRDVAAHRRAAERDDQEHQEDKPDRRSGKDAIVVPLLTGPNPAAYDGIHNAVAASGTAAMVTEPLGPHPLLAEALHVRLAESGLARADRIRQFSIGGTVDGVVVTTMGGPAAVREADVTAVLLAARLAVPVVAAALDAAPSVADQVARLREAGAARIALAPHLVGPEGDLDALAAVAAQVEAECSAPLGAHEGIVRLVNLRYEVALEELASSSATEFGSPGKAEEEAS